MKKSESTPYLHVKINGMGLLFTRKGYLAKEDEFTSMNFLSSPKAYGDFRINEAGVQFEAESGELLNLPVQNIKACEVVREPACWWYIGFLTIIPILLGASFAKYYLIPGTWTIENLVILPFALIIPTLFVYLTLYQRRWVRLCSKDGSASGYISFDWRMGYFRLPWSRQDNIFMWLINRGDCAQVCGIIDKIKKDSKN